MNLKTERYLDQNERWPKSGQHILAHYDDKRIVVYQAYRRSIGEYAVKNQTFGGDFSFNRMSWIKPNFLWMMYRSGWGTKEGQEVTLAIWLYREAFETILRNAVHSSFQASVYKRREAWSAAVADSEIRLQWDPDHAPNGEKVERRAIQLGLKGNMLLRYANEWIIRIDDISEFVAEQRKNVSSLSELRMPSEQVLEIDDPIIAARLQL